MHREVGVVSRSDAGSTGKYFRGGTQFSKRVLGKLQRHPARWGVHICGAVRGAHKTPELQLGSQFGGSTRVTY